MAKCRPSVGKASWVLALSLVACVPKGEHETVVQRLEEERAARSALAEELSKLREAHAEQRRELDALEAELAEARLELEVARRSQREAEGIVEQLRGELGRVGEHIEHYARRNVQLESVREDLVELEKDIAHRLQIFKELSERLDELPRRSGVAIVTFDGFPAIRFAAGSAVSRRGLNAETKKAVAVLGDLVESGGGSEVVVLFAAENPSSRSVAIAIADAVKERAPGARVEALEAEGIDKGTAVAIVRRVVARPDPANPAATAEPAER